MFNKTAAKEILMVATVSGLNPFKETSTPMNAIPQINPSARRRSQFTKAFLFPWKNLKLGIKFKLLF